ncbi:MAG: class I SAM-dependent methyltransferase [Nitrospina sp.]|jgi:predicted SAM-dependent methyltransferase|nr:class I SAM-dependent methyltransferase [Nitrospina sp.]
MKIPRHLIPLPLLKILRVIKRKLILFYESFLFMLNKWFEPRHVNLGGGVFVALGWRNLEAVASHVNPHPFQFTPDCTVPFSDNSVETVYSSHALEHLDQPTVDRLLQEAYRILKPEGRLILKLPDFDRTLDCWKKSDNSFFEDDWGFGGAIETWPDRNIPDTVDSRAAFVFCGFWNDDYGNHFEQAWAGNLLSEQGEAPVSAYHGPPSISKDVLQELKTSHSPKHIAQTLRKMVVEKEPSYYFNHQSAWGRQELKELVTELGFSVVSQETKFVLRECGDIPKITEMLSISMYLLARKEN